MRNGIFIPLQTESPTLTLPKGREPSYHRDAVLPLGGVRGGFLVRSDEDSLRRLGELRIQNAKFKIDGSQFGMNNFFMLLLVGFTNICVSLSKENNKQKTALWKNSNLVTLMTSARLLRAK